MPQKDVSDLTVSEFLKLSEPKEPEVPKANEEHLEYVRNYFRKVAKKWQEREQNP